MMPSSAGLLPPAGNEILIRPEKHTGSTALISNSGSLEIKDHEASLMTNVNVPLASIRFVMVRFTGVGVGL